MARIRVFPARSSDRSTDYSVCLCKKCGKRQAVFGRQCLICQTKCPDYTWGQRFSRLFGFLRGTPTLPTESSTRHENPTDQKR